MSPKAKGTSLRELPILLVSALVLSIIVKTFLIQFFYIPSGSMENTLLVNDRVGVNKFGALFSDIKRGEVVVFRDPANWLSAPYDESTGLSKVVRDTLVFVGVLPDPSKQYLAKPSSAYLSWLNPARKPHSQLPHLIRNRVASQDRIEERS
jgi:signal peptidase I